MDDEQLSGAGAETGEGAVESELDEALEAWPEPDDDIYFGEGAQDEATPEDGDVPDGEAEPAPEPEEDPENPEDSEESKDPEGEAVSPDTVEWGGQTYSVAELVQGAQFGRQAAAEVMRLREQSALLEQYAGMAGMSTQAYLSALRENLEQSRTERFAAERGVTPEAARELIAAKKQAAEAAQLLHRQREAAAQSAQREAQIAPFRELIARFPELRDPQKLPPEVAGAIRAGAHPVVAYQEHLLRTTQAQSQVAQQRQAVKAKSPGSATGVGDGAVDDAFAAFDAALAGY